MGNSFAGFFEGKILSSYDLGWRATSKMAGSDNREFWAPQGCAETPLESLNIFTL